MYTERVQRELQPLIILVNLHFPKAFLLVFHVLKEKQLFEFLKLNHPFSKTIVSGLCKLLGGFDKRTSMLSQISGGLVGEDTWREHVKIYTSSCSHLNHLSGLLQAFQIYLFFYKDCLRKFKLITLLSVCLCTCVCVLVISGVMALITH